MKGLAVASCLLLANATILLGAQSDAELRFETPGGWRKEKIPLPPPFAPDMKLRGLEEIRFAPGMFKPQSDSFFSYVFVFQLENKPALTAEVMERELLAYYRGLATAVLKSRDVTVDTNAFTLKLEKGKGSGGEAKCPPDLRQFTGDLTWVEPFATQKPQILHVEVEMWEGKETQHNYMFVCVSPKPKTAKIWRQMHETRTSFRRLNSLQ